MSPKLLSTVSEVHDMFWFFPLTIFMANKSFCEIVHECDLITRFRNFQCQLIEWRLEHVLEHGPFLGFAFRWNCEIGKLFIWEEKKFFVLPNNNDRIKRVRKYSCRTTKSCYSQRLPNLMASSYSCIERTTNPLNTSNNRSWMNYDRRNCI